MNFRLNAISENNTLLQFDSPAKIIEYFVAFRMGIMEKRRKYQIRRLEGLQLYLDCKIKFITKVTDGEFVFTDFKNKAAMRKALDWVPVPEFVERLLDIAVHSFNQETIVKLEKERKAVLQEITYYEIVTPDALFKKDLKELSL